MIAEKVFTFCFILDLYVLGQKALQPS